MSHDVTTTRSDDEDEQLRHAIQLSLLQEEIGYRDTESEEIRKAIALSLGKPVEQLTAREALGLTLDSDNKKRSLPTEQQSTSPQKRQATTTASKYWDGIVKLTHVTGFTGPNFIRFEEIVDKSSLKKAVVTAMVGSLDWIDEHFPKDANMCIVLHGRPPMRKQLSPTRVLITPPMKDDTYGVFHTKFMLLFHGDYLRVVVGSANLERYDYNDLENVVFIQDFPERASPVASFAQLPRFARDVCDLLDHMQVPQSVKENLLNYEFERAKAHLVASVSGVFEGKDEYNRYGHARLAQIVREIGAADPDRLPQVEMQTSSLGGLNPSYLHELYRSFCGIDPYKDGPKPARLSTKFNELPPIDIVYPTRDTVEDSRLGPSGADTICFSVKSWEKKTFPRQVMCDAISLRPGTLMHSKYIIATLPPKKKKENTPEQRELRGWVYCGSHNATMGAWGKLSLSKASKQPKMSINNWELGVVLPLYEGENDIPAPYLRPPPRYKPGQNAWTQASDW